MQSTDKNFMVPVGGAVVAEGSRTPGLVRAVNEAYPGRAAIGPALDVLITLLEWGSSGWTHALSQRDYVYKYAQKRLEELAAKHRERVLCTPHNPISLAMTLSTLGRFRSSPAQASCDVCGSPRPVPTAPDLASPTDVREGGTAEERSAAGVPEGSSWREGVRMSIAGMEQLVGPSWDARPGSAVPQGSLAVLASAKSRSAPPTPRVTSPYPADPAGDRASLRQAVPGAGGDGFLHGAVPEEAGEPLEGAEAPQDQARDAGADVPAREVPTGSTGADVPAAAPVPNAIGPGAPPWPAGEGDDEVTKEPRLPKRQLTSEYPVTFLGSMLFSRGVTGARVVAPGKPAQVVGITFNSYGAHCNDYPVPYVTMAAAIGMTVGDVDAFIGRLNQCMRELKAKGHPSVNGEPSM